LSAMNNHVLRSLRYTLSLSDAKMAEIAGLASAMKTADTDRFEAMLRREEDDGFEACPDPTLAAFLDGLIIHRRGPSPNAAARSVDVEVDNNLVLKRLRIAFELKDVDMHSIFEAIDFAVTKPELSAFFRQRDHRNFRACGDQILRQFLKGLALRVRAPKE